MNFWKYRVYNTMLHMPQNSSFLIPSHVPFFPGITTFTDCLAIYLLISKQILRLGFSGANAADRPAKLKVECLCSSLPASHLQGSCHLQIYITTSPLHTEPQRELCQNKCQARSFAMWGES